MCRNIRPLNNFAPPATDDEVTAAALQFVRKVSGTTRPSQANQDVFDPAMAVVSEKGCNAGYCHGAPQSDFYMTCGEGEAQRVFNFGQLWAFVDTPVEDSEVLKRPLAINSGGISHSGGVHFDSKDDPDYLTFRAFAEQTADAVLDELGRPRIADTSDMAIGGGKNFGDGLSLINRLVSDFNVNPRHAAYLADSYGMRALDVVEFCRARKDDRPLADGVETTAALPATIARMLSSTARLATSTSACARMFSGGHSSGRLPAT